MTATGALTVGDEVPTVDGATYSGRGQAKVLGGLPCGVPTTDLRDVQPEVPFQERPQPNLLGERSLMRVENAAQEPGDVLFLTAHGRPPWHSPRRGSVLVGLEAPVSARSPTWAGAYSPSAEYVDGPDGCSERTRPGHARLRDEPGSAPASGDGGPCVGARRRGGDGRRHGTTRGR